MGERKREREKGDWKEEESRVRKSSGLASPRLDSFGFTHLTRGVILSLYRLLCLLKLTTLKTTRWLGLLPKQEK